MRNTIKGHLLLLCMLFFSFSLWSNTIYINFESSCIDKYEYEAANDKNNKQTAYHIKLKDWEHLILNVDSEKIFRYTTRPANVKSCRDIENPENLVKNINNGKTKIFVIKRDDYGYFVNEVSSAAYLFSTNYEIGYHDPEFSFAFNLSEPVSGDDLSLNDSNAAVFFEGNVTFKCPKKYLFSIESEDKLIEYTFVPGIGVVKIEPEPNPPFIQEPGLNLTKVNGKSLKSFYKSYCDQKTIVSNSNNSGKNKTGGKKKQTNPKSNLEVLEAGKYASREGNCQIYKDIDRGLYIDRKTGRPAHGECSGNRYKGGFMLNKTNPEADAIVYAGNQVVPSFTIYKNIDTGLYMDRSTGLPADGYFGGNSYSNGVWLNDPDKGLLASKGNTSPSTTTGNIHSQLTCGIYKDLDRNLYIDKNTGGPADITCGGNTFQNGYLISKPSGSQPSKATDSGEILASKGQQTVSPCGILPGAGEHVVQSKETLYSIARRYGVSVKQIRAWNKMGSRQNTIHVCSVLKVAPAFTSKGTPPSPCGISTRYGVHVVQSKETLFSIAKKYNLTVKQLKNLNSINSNTIHPCMELYTKSPAAASTVVPQDYGYTSKGESRVNPYAIPANGVHVVTGNETLYSISQRYGVSIDQIKRLNGLKTDKINLGQHLILVYTSSGSDELMPKGMPKSVPIEYGVYGVKPQNKIVQPFTAKGDEEGKVVYYNSRRKYTVKNDDTLYSISNRFNVGVDRLRKLNELDNKEIIIPGQELYLD